MKNFNIKNKLHFFHQFHKVIRDAWSSLYENINKEVK